MPVVGVDIQTKMSFTFRTLRFIETDSLNLILSNDERDLLLSLKVIAESEIIRWLL